MMMQSFSSTGGIRRAGSIAILFAASISLSACLGGGGGGSGSSSGSTGGTSPTPSGGSSVGISLSADPIAVSQNGTSTLTWSANNAQSCTASGGWGGVKQTSSYETTPPLTQSTEFTLTCVDANGNQDSKAVKVDVVANVDKSASLSWSAPTANTDGSPITNLSSFNVYEGTSADNLKKVASTSAIMTTHTLSDLSSGTHYFAVTAVNSSGTESARSNVASKPIP